MAQIESPQQRDSLPSSSATEAALFAEHPSGEISSKSNEKASPPPSKEEKAPPTTIQDDVPPPSKGEKATPATSHPSSLDDIPLDVVNSYILKYYIRENDMPHILSLLQQGVDPNIVDEFDGISALEWAILVNKGQDFRVANALLSVSADPTCVCDSSMLSRQVKAAIQLKHLEAEKFRHLSAFSATDESFTADDYFNVFFLRKQGYLLNAKIFDFFMKWRMVQGYRVTMEDAKVKEGEERLRGEELRKFVRRV